MNSNVLLVSDDSRDEWSDLLRNIVAEFGTLTVVKPEDVSKSLSTARYSVIIVDDSLPDNVIQLVRSIHIERPHEPILVATTSPTWRRAKEFLLAGASDYIIQTFNRDELSRQIEEACHRPVVDRSRTR